jgi:hypothetical protein
MSCNHVLACGPAILGRAVVTIAVASNSTVLAAPVEGVLAGALHVNMSSISDVVVVLATATPALGDSGTSATSSAIASSSPSSWSATGSASPHPSASPNTANGPVGGGGSGAVVTFAINATGLSDEEVQGRLVLAANLSLLGSPTVTRQTGESL